MSYNALAAGPGGTPNQPIVKAVSATAQMAKSAAPKAGFNSKPGPQATGAMPAMVGDKQKIMAPPSPKIASTMTPRAGEQRSGMESAMGALADKLHKPKGR